MIDAIDRWLEEWANNTITEADVRHSMPLAKVEKPTVVFVLLRMAYKHAGRRKDRDPTEFVLHYLVTVCTQAIEEALPMIDELFIAALDDQDLGVDHQPISPDVWENIGARPQPSFRLVVPLPFRGVAGGLPAAQGNLISPSLATFDGVVVGPDGEPIPRARIHANDSSDVAYSDRFGRFRFSNAIAPDAGDNLQAFACGLEHPVVESSSSEEPVVIRFRSHAKSVIGCL